MKRMAYTELPQEWKEWVAHNVARDLSDQLAINNGIGAVLLEQWGLSAAFAGNDDFVGRAQRLAAKPRVHLAVVCNSQLKVIFYECIKNRIGNLIAYLVWMAFGYGFAGEKTACTRH